MIHGTKRPRAPLPPARPAVSTLDRWPDRAVVVILACAVWLGLGRL
jgi:hypothetical protein